MSGPSYSPWLLLDDADDADRAVCVRTEIAEPSCEERFKRSLILWHIISSSSSSKFMYVETRGLQRCFGWLINITTGGSAPPRLLGVRVYTSIIP